MGKAMQETLQSNIKLQKQALKSRESAHIVREYKELWRIIAASSAREKSEHAYHDHINRIVQYKC